MNPHDLIAKCEAFGVSVKLENGHILLVGQAAAVKNAAVFARPHKENLVAYLSGLDQFNFGDLSTDIFTGHDLYPIHRTNNMAWEFMQADGMSFSDAIKLAREIVSSRQVAMCEAAYIDVFELIQRIRK
jgi:hypothetical protein